MQKLGKRWPLAILVVLAVLGTMLAGCGQAPAGTVSIAGSTTVQPLAETLADAFMDKYPDVRIDVGGGGSSVGVTSVKNGTVDIGTSSREIKEEELPIVKHLVARDGIAIIVRPGNPVNGLTRAQVRDIFSGVITNWKEVGGPDHDIYVVVRESGSGTRAAFEEMVMAKPEPAVSIVSTALQQSSNGGVKQAVGGDSYAIGFISFGYVDDTVKALDIDGIEATAENAKNGTYPIVRPLYFLTKEEPTGLVKDFIDFCLSDEGQAIVADEGYVTVN
ncbi:MAG: phosphate ABC transporter substrate-binding protein [Dehalococcoidia bacterium]|nr:phosphate ABC transporter substrate-binding protein [Dehalococcoidia bacterium]